MQFKDFFKIINESKNFYYSIPTDKELLLYDFYALDVLNHFAQKRFSPNNLEAQLAGYDEDEPEMISLQDARKTLIPYLRKELLDAMKISIACEMRHSRSDYLNVIDDDLRPVYVFYYKENHSHKLGPSFHKTTRHRNRGNQPSNNNDYSGRKNSVKSFNKTLKKFGMERTMEMAEQIFRKGAWSSAYGGPRWADIVKCWLDLYKSETLEKMSTYIDHAYDLQHNTGSVFNKVQEYYKDGVGFDWLSKALDKKYEAVPWELVDNASSTIKRMGRKILQRAKLNRNNNPNELKEGDLVIYKKSKTVDHIDMMDGGTYKIKDINELYGKATVEDQSRENVEYKNILLSKLEKKDPIKKGDKISTSKIDIKVGDKVIHVGKLFSYFDKNGIYEVKRIWDGEYFGKKCPIIFTNTKLTRGIWTSYDELQWKKVDASENKPNRIDKTPLVKNGDYLQPLVPMIKFAKGKNYKIIDVSHNKMSKTYSITVADNTGNYHAVYAGMDGPILNIMDLDEDLEENGWKLIKKEDRWKI